MMVCASCKTLNYKIVYKSCYRCSSERDMPNIAVICESCAEQGNQCSFCLKTTRKDFSKPKSGCSSCGG